MSAYPLILAGLAFVWFTVGLRAWLAADAPAGRIISNLGVLGGGAMAAAAMVGASVAGDVAFGNNEPVPMDGDVIRVTMNLFFPFLFVVFGLVSAALIATVALTAKRTSALPSWVTYMAWLAVLGSVLGVAFFPFVLPLLWYLVVGIVGLTRASTASPAVIASTT